MLDGDGWSLGGHGFSRGGPVTFEERAPSGTAESWRLLFVPLSGEAGGEIRVHSFEWLPAPGEPDS